MPRNDRAQHTFSALRPLSRPAAPGGRPALPRSRLDRPTSRPGQRRSRPGGTDLVVARFGSTDQEGEQRRKGTGNGSRNLRALFAPAVRPALLVGVILAVLQQFSGINTILYQAPTIMGKAGLSASNAIFYPVFIGAINVIITVVAVNLVDQLGRRPLLLGSLAAMAVSIALLGVAFAVDLPPVLMLVFMLLYIVGFGIGLGPVFWVLLGEIFPPAQRAEGSGTGATVNWLSDFVLSLVFLPLISAIGGSAHLLDLRRDLRSRCGVRRQVRSRDA